MRAAALGFVTLVAIAAAGAPASAADLAARPYTKAPVMVDPSFNWSGFYIGGNVGGLWDRSRWTDIFGNTIGLDLTSGSNGSATIGGVHGGFNYQLGQLVLGIEGDYEATKIRSSFGAAALCAGFPPGICTTSQDWVASLRGRAGVSFNRLLVYGTGGVAFTDIGHTTVFPGFVGASVYGTQSRTGWVAGLGAEYAITNNWIAGVEWKHFDFGSTTVTAALPATDRMQFRETDDSVVARLSYKFGWEGPVVAKY